MEKANKYPILNSYNVLLACPNCGEDMKHIKPIYEITDNTVYYQYECLICGCRKKSKTFYPFTQIEYDKNQKEIIEVDV